MIDIRCGEFTYEAAHYLPNVPIGHKCGRMHGHSYRLIVTVRGPINPDTGWVIDFADVKAAVAPLVAKLDHQTLNDIEGLRNPTVENQLVWLWGRIDLPGLYELTLHETATNSATYGGSDD